MTVHVADSGEPPLSATRTFHLTVLEEELRLSIEALSSGLMRIETSAAPNLDYELQTSSDLETWEVLLQFRMNSSPQTHIDPESDQNSLRFYRLRLAED